MGESYIGEIDIRHAAFNANRGEICLIYCGDGRGYYQGEECDGKPPRYILSSTIST